MGEEEKSVFYGVEDAPSPHMCIVFALQVSGTRMKLDSLILF